MLYAVLKAVHSLSLIAWIGGMFFTLVCLRPALAVLEGSSRVNLMVAVLRRFFTVVSVAIVLMAVSGACMLWMAQHPLAAPGPRANVPLRWEAMIAIGLVMTAVFGHIRLVLFRRLQRAAIGHDLKSGAQLLGQVRHWVGLNLALGVIVVVAMQVGAAA